MQLYERIKRLAQDQKLTIAELEREIGISNGQIRKWQNQTPGVDKLQKVADYFGVTTDYLLGRTDDPHAGQNEEQRDLTVQEALDSVMSYDGEPLTDNDREILTRIIEGYLDKK